MKRKTSKGTIAYEDILSEYMKEPGFAEGVEQYAKELEDEWQQECANQLPPKTA